MDFDFDFDFVVVLGFLVVDVSPLMIQRSTPNDAVKAGILAVKITVPTPACPGFQISPMRLGWGDRINRRREFVFVLRFSF